MSGLCVEIRLMMSVFDGPCLPVFFVCLCDNSEVVLYARYVFVVLGCVMLCGNLGVESWFCLCIRGPGRVWLLFVGVWFWVRGGFIASRRVVVGVLLRECLDFYPRL